MLKNSWPKTYSVTGRVTSPLKLVPVLFAVLLLFGTTGGHQLGDGKPNPHMIALETMARKLSAQPLTAEDRQSFVAALVKAAIRTEREGRDPYISDLGDLWKLMLAIFPEVTSRNEDYGLPLTAVMHYANSFPEFRPAIAEVLKGERSHGQCRK
jgi:hypothetical protein